MSCFSIVLSGKDYCQTDLKGIYQQVVFIRKSDIDTYSIVSDIIDDIPTHLIRFALKENEKGFRFDFPQNSTVVTASFDKTFSNGTPKYSHKITIGIDGVSAVDKWRLKQFDLSQDYFVAIQNMNNIVEIYGFQNGFITDNYTFENNVVLNLNSPIPESDVPYIYKSLKIDDEVYDFDNDFDQKMINLNNFNNDFNNDFNN